MSVLEYAQDVNKSVSYILDMCKKLDIKVSGEEDILDDDAIVMLDNAISSDEPEESSDSEDLVDEEILKKMDDDDYYDEVIDTMVDKKISNYNKDRVKKNKNKQNKNIKAAKKAMYKNKEKLVSNSNTNDNIVLYKENMTIKELAKALNEPVNELIKKLMMLGVMGNINSSISYDDASVLALEYNKTLKKELMTYQILKSLK